MSLPYVEEFRDIFLPHNVAAPKSRPLMLAGDDLGNVMGEWHPNRFFHGNNF
jgi:hypothetical protein